MTGRGASCKLASFNPRRLGIRILVRWFDAPLQIFVLLSQLCDPSLPLLLSFFDSMTVRLLQFSCHPLPLRNNVHHRHIPLRVFQGVGAFDLQPSVRTPLGVTIALALASFHALSSLFHLVLKPRHRHPVRQGCRELPRHLFLQRRIVNQSDI